MREILTGREADAQETELRNLESEEKLIELKVCFGDIGKFLLDFYIFVNPLYLQEQTFRKSNLHCNSWTSSMQELVLVYSANRLLSSLI